jgi:hypothetical protein
MGGRELPRTGLDWEAVRAKSSVLTTLALPSSREIHDLAGKICRF